MKYVDEYRDKARAERLAERLARAPTQSHTIMEICGGQTHAIMRYGLDQLLPDTVALVHGPGCPVCVTPLELIDKALLIAERTEVIFCSFGDMLRVPGSHMDLLQVKAQGGDVRIVYSPLDAVKFAQENPEREVVFFAVGFETTAPGNAMAVQQAHRLGLKNFSILTAHVLVPPAIEAILSAPSNRVEGFLAAGHVCTVMGYTEYEPLVAQHGIPIVVTGFEPIDILEGVCRCVEQLEAGRAEVENAYPRVVKREGNAHARALLEKTFAVVPRKWRGIGEIPASGLALVPEFETFDAEKRFDLGEIVVDEPEECISGLVLQGRKKPHECSEFGARCTPETPLGAPMVSAEGACAAYFRYRRAAE